MVDKSLYGMSAEDIDKEVPIPYHYQLRELLRDEIAAGRWVVGERLPSERELCETFNLSRTTVREAIEALVNEGLLRREKGRGTFVAEPKILESLLQTPIGFTDSMLEQGYHVETKVLRMEVVSAPSTIGRELRLRSDESVIVIDRLRFVLNEPILLVTSYVPQKICPSLIDEDLTNNSLYQLLQNRYRLRIARAIRFMEAVSANELEAKLLHIEAGSPLMLIESTAYLKDGTPLEYFKARHRGDRTRFLVESFKRVLKDGDNS
jgi:GntR family transcriptional regulator